MATVYVLYDEYDKESEEVPFNLHVEEYALIMKDIDYSEVRDLFNPTDENPSMFVIEREDLEYYKDDPDLTENQRKLIEILDKYWDYFADPIFNAVILRVD